MGRSVLTFFTLTSNVCDSAFLRSSSRLLHGVLEKREGKMTEGIERKTHCFLQKRKTTSVTVDATSSRTEFVGTTSFYFQCFCPL